MAEKAKKEPTEGELREIEIGFGTLFKIKPEGIDVDSVGVITDPGEGSWFFFSRVFEEDDGTRWIYSGATGGLRYIEDVVGQLSKEEVIAAARKGYELKDSWLKPKQLEKLINYLEEDSKKEQRMVKIKS